MKVVNVLDLANFKLVTSKIFSLSYCVHDLREVEVVRLFSTVGLMVQKLELCPILNYDVSCFRLNFKLGWPNSD